MTNFKQWLFSEAAIMPENIQYDDQGRPNFRIYFMNDAQIIGLEVLKGGRYEFAGDLTSDVFGNTQIMEGYKLFNWHNDLPKDGGYSPMFYDIAMELATKRGGYLVSATLVNRLVGAKNAKENKGHAGGDTSDGAEAIYKFYYERRPDVEKVQPNLILMNEPDQASKPYLYEIYRKNPTIMPKLIQMNSKGQPVLVSGAGMHAKPITNF